MSVIINSGGVALYPRDRITDNRLEELAVARPLVTIGHLSRRSKHRAPRGARGVRTNDQQLQGKQYTKVREDASAGRVLLAGGNPNRGGDSHQRETTLVETLDQVALVLGTHEGFVEPRKRVDHLIT